MGSPVDLQAFDNDTDLQQTLDFFNFNASDLNGLGTDLSSLGDFSGMRSLDYPERVVSSPAGPSAPGPQPAEDHETRMEDSHRMEESGDAGTCTGDAGASGDEGGPTSAAQSKRRRRIRNAKQQELNRLAQQRYRQRKKQRYTDLQSTVGTLANQLDALTVLEREVDSLKSNQDMLHKQIILKDTALANANQQLSAQSVQIKTQQITLGAQAAQIAGQTAQLAQQAAALESTQAALRHSQAQNSSNASSSTSSGSAVSSTSLANIDPQLLADRLLLVVKAALADVSANSPVAPAPVLTSEQLLGHISRTLHSCCRELLSVSGGKAALAVGAPAALPVSCC